MTFGTIRISRAREPVKLDKLVEFNMRLLKCLACLRSDVIFLKVFDERLVRLHLHAIVRRWLPFMAFLVSDQGVKFHFHRKRVIQVVFFDFITDKF